MIMEVFYPLLIAIPCYFCWRGGRVEGIKRGVNYALYKLEKAEIIKVSTHKTGSSVIIGTSRGELELR
jgi:hypothetical protein